MPTYARSINGSVVGMSGLGGTPFNMKGSQFRIHIEQSLDDVSGWGDGGNTYWSPGSNKWTVALNGVLLTGTFGTVGVANLSGTNSLLTSGTFTSDAGRTYSGSVRVTIIDNTTIYGKGEVGVSLIGYGEGPLAEV